MKTILIMLLFPLIHMQLDCDIANGVFGIKPLESTITEVEESLGKHKKIDELGFYIYESKNSRILVNYSAVQCEDASHDRGRYRVSPFTVISYVVYFKKPLRLSEVEIDEADFVKDTSGDVSETFNYSKKDSSVIIVVSIRNDDEFVETAYYWPSGEQKSLLGCRDH